jgi:hypothetical protein
MTACVLLLFLTCHPARKTAAVLAVTQSAFMLADGYNTANNTSHFERKGLYGPSEANPISRVLIGSRPTWSRMLPVGIAVVELTSITSDRLQRSHGWIHHLRWLPQIVSISGNSAGIAYTLRTKP